MRDDSERDKGVVKKVLACSDMADRSVAFAFGSGCVLTSLSAVDVVVVEEEEVCALLVVVVAVFEVCVGVEVVGAGGGTGGSSGGPLF